VGDVQVEKGADVSFPITNNGKAPLHILSAEGECGCLTPHFPPVIGPGRSAEIRVHFEPQPLWSGKVEKGVKVKTDDPTQPEARLVLAGNVVPYIRTDPQSPLVINTKRGETYTRDLRLIPRPGHSVSISNPVSDSPFVKATLGSPDRDRAYPLHLKIGPMIQTGDLTARIELATTEPKVPELPVIIVALAQNGPVVSPRELSVSTVSPAHQGKELTRLQVFTRGGELRILSVNTGNPGLEAEIKPESAGHFYDVVLRYAGGWKSGPVAARIKIRTDDRSAPVLTVPFSATVQ
jgi:hypothetical protein